MKGLHKRGRGEKGVGGEGGRKEEGKNFTKEAAMAKYWASVVAQKVSGSAIEWA